MNTYETRDSQAVDYGKAGPTAVRLLLGARLRKLREAAGVSREDAGYAIRSSESKISRLELGRTGCKLRDVSDLLDLYLVGEGERATLLAMAGSANAPGWWQQYGDAVPGWFAPYLGLEQAAEVIRCYEVQFVPGLLQTADYARAVFQIEAAAGPGIEQQVSVRMRRQRVLQRPGPPRLWAVIDEAALRRPIGGPEVMEAQLAFLIEQASRPNITIQLLPYSVGAHAAEGGAFTLLRFAEADLPDVVYLEHLTGAQYIERPEDVEQYARAMDRISVDALHPDDTVQALNDLIRKPLY
jgi:transcriptional regulator with XRE-family HTH domain